MIINQISLPDITENADGVPGSDIIDNTYILLYFNLNKPPMKFEMDAYIKISTTSPFATLKQNRNY